MWRKSQVIQMLLVFKTRAEAGFLFVREKNCCFMYLFIYVFMYLLLCIYVFIT